MPTPDNLQDGWARAVVDAMIVQEHSEVVWAPRGAAAARGRVRPRYGPGPGTTCVTALCEAVEWIVNSDLSADKMVAYQWIDDGMPIG